MSIFGKCYTRGSCPLRFSRRRKSKCGFIFDAVTVSRYQQELETSRSCHGILLPFWCFSQPPFLPRACVQPAAVN